MRCTLTSLLSSRTQVCHLPQVTATAYLPVPRSTAGRSSPISPGYNVYGVNPSPTREEDKARASGEGARVRAPLGIFSRVRQGKAEKSSKRAATDNKKWSGFSHTLLRELIKLGVCQWPCRSRRWVIKHPTTSRILTSQGFCGGRRATANRPGRWAQPGCCIAIAATLSPRRLCLPCLPVPTGHRSSSRSISGLRHQAVRTFTRDKIDRSVSKVQTRPQKRKRTDPEVRPQMTDG